MMKNPFVIILEMLKKHKVRFLVTGGQACIFYGATEFTRDSDIAVLCNVKNLQNIKKALEELDAHQVFFPPLEIRYLRKGHACHFICRKKTVADFRIDVMSRLRGCPAFSIMWKSRKIVDIPGVTRVPLLGIKHLVASKKTQRDKDWPMVRRLLENDYYQENKPDKNQINWWIRECRTPGILMDISVKFPEIFSAFKQRKCVCKAVMFRDTEKIEQALLMEELHERRKDRKYWRPLRKELERMRLERKI